MIADYLSNLLSCRLKRVTLPSYIIVILISMCSLCASGQAPYLFPVAGGMCNFGFEKQDTVLSLDCNEYAVSSNDGLFYSDLRSAWEISMRVKCTMNLTEQSFLCKEGGRGDLYADLTIGFDPGPEKFFAEIKDSAGDLHRIFVGEKVTLGEWYDLYAASAYTAASDSSALTLSIVSPDGKKAENKVVYPGYALPYRASRWVIGRGFPGGFPNSLQVRKGGLSGLSIKGEGLPHKAGENPLLTDRFTADPAALVVGDRIYLYVGEDCAAPGGWFTMPHWVVYSSDNMKDWTCHGEVLRAGDFPHANPNGAWAAQVVEKDGKFFFYVTLDDTRNGQHMIDVAVGDSPLGPFEVVGGEHNPIVTDDMTPDSHRANADIDPTVLIEGDSAWIAWGNGDCYMAMLNKEMTGIEGEIRHVGLRNYSEGPWLFKRADIYYLVYAADAPGVTPEQLAYATAEHIDGPWTYRGLLSGPARHGFTIHPSVNEFKGKWYLFYHDGCFGQHNTPGGDCRRHVCVEEIHFNPDGTIQPVTLTHKGVSE